MKFILKNIKGNVRGGCEELLVEQEGAPEEGGEKRDKKGIGARSALRLRFSSGSDSDIKIRNQERLAENKRGREKVESGGDGRERGGEFQIDGPQKTNASEANLAVLPKDTTEVTVSAEKRNGLSVLDGPPVNLEEEQAALEELPHFQCNTCAIGPDCPEYKAGFVCKYRKAFHSFPVRSADSVMALMREIVERNKVRLRRAFLTEELVSGGHLDPNVSNMSELLMRQAERLTQLSRDVKRVDVKIVGSQEQSSGILSRLFGAEPEQKDIVLNPPEPPRSVLPLAVSGRTSDTPVVTVHGEDVSDP